MKPEFVNPRRPEPTAEELADQEEAEAVRLEEMGMAEDEAQFLHADAAERRRLSEIIRQQEKEEEEEFMRWKSLIRSKKQKKEIGMTKKY